MALKSLLAGLACLVISTSSHAGVIYEWRPFNDETPRDITLRLEFTDAAVQGGALDFSVPFMDWQASYPDAGLVSLFYAFPGLDTPMSYRPADGQFRMGLGMLDMSLRFEPGGYLSGWIRANDASNHIELASQGRIFTILGADSDRGMPEAGCGWTTGVPCGGATGELRQVLLAQPARQVPEPVSLALFAAGGLAALGARRRRVRS
ncbi:PEP-CTERM sorting domain-containing protein [Massilia consociata]|uniref:PEP-CTERM sorting domain-containing protein n=1 Tax=Massilia consociata TaxID=760117 RepID=A0ABV6FE59_9BURK